MKADETRVHFTIEIDASNSDAEEFDQLTRDLGQQLYEIDTISVRWAIADNADSIIGAKGVPYYSGILTVDLNRALLATLIELLHAWTQRVGRIVKVTTLQHESVTLGRKDKQEEIAVMVERLGREARPDSSAAQKRSVRLFHTLESQFNESELRSLCFEVGVDYDSLGGYNKSDKARELIINLERRGRISELVEAGRRLRPDIAW